MRVHIVSFLPSENGRLVNSKHVRHFRLRLALRSQPRRDGHNVRVDADAAKNDPVKKPKK